MFCEFILDFGPEVQEEMPFKDILYPELLRPCCLVELNYLGKFRERHYEEHFCKISLKLRN